MKIKDFFYTENDKLQKDEISNDWWLERFRNWRADELAKSDWTQVQDSPADKQMWANYRHLLRNLTKENNFADAELPAQPGGN